MGSARTASWLKEGLQNPAGKLQLFAIQRFERLLNLLSQDFGIGFWVVKFKQKRRGNPQSPCDPEDYFKRRINLTALKPAEMLRVDID